MESISQQIHQSVLSVLPHLSEEVIKCVSTRLTEEIGVVSISDLALVTSEDLTDLKPMDRRKLLKAWTPSQTQNDMPVLMEHVLTSNVSISQTELNEHSSENWTSFCIPWEIMPVKLMKALEAGERPMPPLKKKLTQITADAMHKMARRPGRKAIGIVSKKIVARYPSLKDSLCGETFGAGNFSIFKSLENRIDYLNRGQGQKAYKRRAEEQVSSENKFSKYGCINWQPEHLMKNETEETQVLKKDEMVSMLTMGPHYDELRLSSLIEETFFSQRREINKGLTIEEVQKNWPALLTVFGMHKHFELLVGVDLKEKFSKKLDSKGEVLIRTLKSVLKSSNTSLQFEVEMPSFQILIRLLMAYFKEDENSIFRLVNISTAPSDVLNIDIPATPCIIVCGLDLLNAECFMLAIDGIVVNGYISNFIDAILALFSSFYIFNICYPTEASSTLEFLQRCFANINPSKGSRKNRSKGKKETIDSKVLTLLNIVSDQEWLKC